MGNWTKFGACQSRAFLGAAAAAAAAMLTALGSAYAADAGAPSSKGSSQAAGQETAKAALSEHEEARKQKEADCAVFTTWFTTAQAMHCAVTSKGERELLKAGVAFPSTPLDEANLKALFAALPKLPEGQAVQKREDVLIVSWRKGEVWKTRQYSRSSPPPEVAAMFVLLGVPQDRPQRR